MQFKKIMILTSVAFLGLFPVVHAGPSVSGGGGGGRFSLSSGYTPGKFDVTVYSAPDGVIGTMLPLYLAAGAIRREDQRSVYYSLPGLKSDQVIIANKNPQNPEMAYQLNFHIAYADLIETKSGGSKDSWISTLGFRSPFATALYTGFIKSGVQPKGTSPEGNTYWGNGLLCEVSPRFGTWCSFKVGK